MQSTLKPIILTFIAFYIPGYRGGGPIRTIANMVNRLGDDFDFRIVTSDRDFGDQHPYNAIEVDAWNQVGQARVFYASPSSRSLWKFARLIRDTPHDVLYLNSFFDPKFTLTPLLACRLRLAPRSPVVLAPRGEFSEGALKLKRWKKAPFINLVFRVRMFDNVLWQASTVYESADIKRVMCIQESSVVVTNNIAVAPDLSQKIYLSEENNNALASMDKGSLRVCFLSRIAPMKNLDYALKVLAQVKVRVQFDIYGPKERPVYWEECEALIKKLPPNIRTAYGGSVENSKVRAVIGMYDLFFVPSRGENFGHVFMEALSAGVPILVSDQTPWRDLKRQQLGWDISLEQPDEFVRALEEAAGFDAVTRAEMRARCVDFSRDIAEDSGALEMNRNLFLRASSFAHKSAI